MRRVTRGKSQGQGEDEEEAGGMLQMLQIYVGEKQSGKQQLLQIYFLAFNNK